MAKGQGKKVEILIAESKIGDKKYGKITAKKLKGYGIPVKLIPDSAIRDNLYGLKGKSKVFVGLILFSLIALLLMAGQLVGLL